MVFVLRATEVFANLGGVDKRITLRDVAARAGVHYTTVARALRDHPEIKKPTRDAIKRLAEEMGYVPDPVLSALSAYRNLKRPATYQGLIAWVTCFPQRRDWQSMKIARECHQGACKRAGELGYQVAEFWLLEPGMSPERFSSILESRNVLGLLLAPLPEAGMRLNLRWERFSNLAIGFTLSYPRLHVVSNHHFHSMSSLVRYVRDLGYGKLGLAMAMASDDRVNHAWFSAFLYDHHRHGGSKPPCCFLPERIHRGLSPSFRTWLLEERPEVVLAREEYVYDWILEAGFRVPEDLGFALLANDAPERHFSCLDENAMLMGATAIDLLAGMIYRNEKGIPSSALRHYVESDLVPGTTLLQRHPSLP